MPKDDDPDLDDGFYDYRLTPKQWDEVVALRGKGKWTWQEMADKLGISLTDILYDVEIDRREKEWEDE